MADVKPAVEAVAAAPAGMSRVANPDALCNSCADLDNYNEIYVQQTTKGCFQEAMGCEANNEFLVFSKKAPGSGDGGTGAVSFDNASMILYSVEESSCCCRLICKAQRTSRMATIPRDKRPSKAQAKEWSEGKKWGDFAVTAYDRPFRNMVSNCKICCFQEMTIFKDGGVPGRDTKAGSMVGMIKEDCWYCVPSFSVYDEAGTPKYQVQQPTCCGGTCVNICPDGIGMCNCKIPFYIYKAGENVAGQELRSQYIDPTNPNEPPAPAQITKLFSGIMRMQTDADSFELLTHAAATSDDKALLLNMVYFLNMNFFEAQKEQNNGGADMG